MIYKSDYPFLFTVYMCITGIQLVVFKLSLIYNMAQCVLLIHELLVDSLIKTATERSE